MAINYQWNILFAFYSDPSEVMLCILPDVVTGDVSLHIHVTLLEAFCFENDIRILKVNDTSKLQLALARKASKMAAAGATDHMTLPQYSEEDCTCLLVEVRSVFANSLTYNLNPLLTLFAKTKVRHNKSSSCVCQ